MSTRYFSKQLTSSIPKIPSLRLTKPVLSCRTSKSLRFDPMFHRLLEIGDTKKLSSYLTDHPNAVNTPFEDDGTDTSLPLHTAVIGRNPDAVIPVLSSYGVNPNLTSQSGVTALHIAAFKGILNAVPLLISCGADISLQDNAEGNTPLHFAMWSSDRYLITSLLKHGADPLLSNSKGVTPLHLALALKNMDIFNLIWKALSEEQKSYAVTLKDRILNRSLLHYAAMRNVSQAIPLLLQSGADPLETDSLGFNPLTYSIPLLESFRHIVNHLKTIFSPQALKTVLEAPIISKSHYQGTTKRRVPKSSNDPHNPLIQTPVTPLYYAASSRSPNVISILLEYNVDPFIPDSNGFTPLHVSLFLDATNCFTKILQASVEISPEKTLSSLTTPLSQISNMNSIHFLCYTGNKTALIEVLSLFPAILRTEAADDEGRTYITCAGLSQNPSFVKYFLNNYSGKINFQDPIFKNSVLHHLATLQQRCNPEVLELFLKDGADPLLQNKESVSPLKIAGKNKILSHLFTQYSKNTPESEYELLDPSISHPLSNLSEGKNNQNIYFPENPSSSLLQKQTPSISPQSHHLQPSSYDELLSSTQKKSSKSSRLTTTSSETSSLLSNISKSSENELVDLLYSTDTDANQGIKLPIQTVKNMLISAVEKDLTSVVRSIRRLYGPEIDSSFINSSHGKENTWLVATSIKNMNPEIFSILLRLGGDVKSVDGSHSAIQTIQFYLHKATISRVISMLKVALKIEPDVILDQIQSSSSVSGRHSLLNLAIKFNNLPLFDYLLSCRVPILLSDSSNLIVSIIMRRQWDLLTCLLDHPNVSKKDLHLLVDIESNSEMENSLPPIVLVAYPEHSKLFYKLLQYGANPNIPAYSGLSLLNHIAKCGYWDLLESLFQFQKEAYDRPFQGYQRISLDEYFRPDPASGQNFFSLVCHRFVRKPKRSRGFGGHIPDTEREHKVDETPGNLGHLDHVQRHNQNMKMDDNLLTEDGLDDHDQDTINSLGEEHESDLENNERDFESVIKLLSKYLGPYQVYRMSLYPDHLGRRPKNYELPDLKSGKSANYLFRELKHSARNMVKQMAATKKAGIPPVQFLRKKDLIPFPTGYEHVLGHNAI